MSANRLARVLAVCLALTSAVACGADEVTCQRADLLVALAPRQPAAYSIAGELCATRPELRQGAMVQLLVEAAGDPAPEFPRADIEKLKAEISQAEQFTINFDYLARRVRRRA